MMTLAGIALALCLIGFHWEALKTNRRLKGMGKP